MNILKAKRTDATTILRLAGKLRKSAYVEMNYPVPAQLADPNSKKYLLSLFYNSEIHILVAKEKGEIIGFCMAVETPKIIEGRNRIEIYELIIDKKHQGKGIGSTFLKEVEKIAKEKRILFVKVATGTKLRANEFYRKNGYVHFENLYRKKIA